MNRALAIFLLLAACHRSPFDFDPDRRLMEDLDRNHDGFLDEKDGSSAVFRDALAVADQDRDGRVSMAELVAALAPKQDEGRSAKVGQGPLMRPPEAGKQP